MAGLSIHLSICPSISPSILISIHLQWNLYNEPREDLLNTKISQFTWMNFMYFNYLKVLCLHKDKILIVWTLSMPTTEHYVLTSTTMYSLNSKMSYHQLLQNLKAGRYEFRYDRLLWNLTGVCCDAGKTPAKFQSVWKILKFNLLWLWDLARSCDQKFYCLVKRGPGDITGYFFFKM